MTVSIVHEAKLAWGSGYGSSVRADAQAATAEESAEVARRRREAVARREAGRTAADHTAFDARIQQEPADATAVAVPPPASLPDLRQAIIWREILSPPTSLRDD